MSKQALISVSDKSNLEALLPKLEEYGYRLVSTGGTAKTIRDLGYEVADISEITDFPEILDGRVKTLHPKVHGGILARRNLESHQNALIDHKISYFDMLVVNLYPFAETISNGHSQEDAIENIDIGGPSMIRSAAKNYEFVTVVSSPEQYEELIEDLDSETQLVNAAAAANLDIDSDSATATLTKSKTKPKGETSLALRKKFAALAFAKTAKYDSVIASYLLSSCAGIEQEKIESFIPPLGDLGKLRYGENPHQKALLLRNPVDRSGLAYARQLQGKELSFNNYLDLNAAWNIVSEFDSSIPCLAIIKHNNPCGVAIAPNVAHAYREALDCDSLSAFGGIVASNSVVDLDAANEMTQIFLEAVVAPGFTEDALKIFANKKNLRLLEMPKQESSEAENSIESAESYRRYDIKSISGGFLVQEENDFLMDAKESKVVTKKQISEEEWVDLLFAWKICKHVKSNAIVVVKDGKTIGIGCGQTSRVDSVEKALKAMDISTRGAVMASDAFFPFPDSIKLAAQNHVSAVIQPGGSIKDKDVIAACDELDMAMVFTGTRHFKH